MNVLTCLIACAHALRWKALALGVACARHWANPQPASAPAQSAAKRHGIKAGQGRVYRLIGEALHLADKRNAPAQRTLEQSPTQPSLRTGAGETLHLPSSRALGGKSGMTRAKPLVLILREGSLPKAKTKQESASPSCFGLVSEASRARCEALAMLTLGALLEWA